MNQFLLLKSKIKRFLHMFHHSFGWVRCYGSALPPFIFGSIGEDAVIEHHIYYLGLDNKAPGAYLDIGCHHPIALSNTYRFYGRALGYVVDVGNAKAKLWKRIRPKDIFLNTAVVPNDYQGEEVEFVIAGKYGTGMDHVSGYGVEPTKDSSHLLKNQRIIKVSALKARDLGGLVSNDSGWFKAAWRVLSIDIEGADFKILEDINLQLLRPDIVAAEDHVPNEVSQWDRISYYRDNSPLVNLMTNLGYSLQSVVGPTLIFVRIASYKGS
jgi:hypothetical protein